MRLFFSMVKRQILPTVLMGLFYLFCMLLSMFAFQRDTALPYKISAYVYASEPLDFFFSLFVTLTFSFSTFFLKKDGYLQYVALRISPKKYCFLHFCSCAFLAFCMVWSVHFLSLCFSVHFSSITNLSTSARIENYPFGFYQAHHPLLFGFVWSVYKAIVAMLFCFFTQKIVLYIENFFVALFFPFLYVLTENFLTSLLGLSRYSFTTAFVLNRLKPTAMRIENMLGSLVFLCILFMFFSLWLRWANEKNSSFL